MMPMHYALLPPLQEWMTFFHIAAPLLVVLDNDLNSTLISIYDVRGTIILIRYKNPFTRKASVIISKKSACEIFTVSSLSVCLFPNFNLLHDYTQYFT